ncbi:amidohydrolase family protein [Pseudonocardia eucalypti]|uniref:Amidohydrolase family protein n=1 Tax=Pseudonocardia eucalypti TaxID=648755 RepID=A0ABP9Q3T4_9PSEU|nr:cytosine/adenosine deaminase-related metal-dependent hydrolase [Pseudonocardia eucalypti]
MSRTLLRGGQVVSMSPTRPDSERAEILVDGPRILAVGEDLDPGGAEVVDLTGRVVIPGLVNAHLHTWQTPMRFVGADWALPRYLALAHGEIARHYRPADTHIGTLAGALNQIDSGVTTIGDWSHNCTTGEHADAAVDALTQAGVRAVFLHGTPHGLLDRPHDIDEIDRLLDGPIATNPLLSLGMAIKGPQLSKPEIAIADLRAAAERGLLASMHQSAGPPGPGWHAVTEAGLWSPSANIVHGTGLPPNLVDTLVASGVTFTCTPENELGQGHTTRLADNVLAAGSAPSLGTDTEMVTPGEVLIAARILLAMQRGLQHDQAFTRTGLGAGEVTLTAKDALSWATVEGARALGLSDRVGRIEAGMEADLTVIDARMLNLWPPHDAIAGALNANTANIEAVMIAGQWRKRDHKLFGVDLPTIKGELQRSGDEFARRVRRSGALDKMRRRVVRRVVDRQLSAQADPARRT